MRPLRSYPLIGLQVHAVGVLSWNEPDKNHTCITIDICAVRKRAPDNISRDQKQNVLKSLKRNSGESIINDIGDQLLK